MDLADAVDAVVLALSGIYNVYLVLIARVSQCVHRCVGMLNLSQTFGLDSRWI